MTRAFEIGSRAFQQDGRARQASFSTTTYVDSFDDQSLSEYSGDTGDFGFSTTTTKDSTASLYTTGDPGGAYVAIRSSSGLDNYPQQGDRIQWWVQPGTVSAAGIQQLTLAYYRESADDTYFCRIKPRDDEFQLSTRSNAGSFVGDTIAAVGLTAGEWHRIVVEWDDGSAFGGNAGDHTGFLYDKDGNELAQTTTVNDNVHDGTGPGHIQWAVNIDNGSDNYFDECVITNR